MVSIETYKDNYKADWNNFVDSSKNSTFLFNRDFMDYHSNQGLNYWKEGFGARSLTHDFYEIKTLNFKKLDSILT